MVVVEAVLLAAEAGHSVAATLEPTTPIWVSTTTRSTRAATITGRCVSDYSTRRKVSPLARVGLLFFPSRADQSICGLTAEIQVEPFGPQTPRDMPDRPREQFRGRGRGIRGGIGLGRTTPSSGARTPTTGLGSGSRRHPAIILDGVVTWGGGWAPLFIKAGELFRDGEVDVKDEEGECANLRLLGEGSEPRPGRRRGGSPRALAEGKRCCSFHVWKQYLRVSAVLGDCPSPKILPSR